MYKIMNKKKVIIGISGGVDSSVAAWLLKNNGYKVEGLFMKNWEENDKNNCSIKKDLIDAENVCNQLNIYLHKVNFSSEYWQYVFKNFLKEYKKGNTPNPDILCNKEIKFKLFLKFAIKYLNADFIATGHYAKNKKIGKYYFLLKGIDPKKDQSYFLYTLNSKILKKVLFPLGNLYKIQVRKIAESLKLITAKKKDSTGICFIGKRNFKNFLSKYLPVNPGNIIDFKGKIIGNHQGIPYYTIGQRKGLGIGGIKNNKNKQPWYVIEKNIISNEIIVGQGLNHPQLQSIGLLANKVHWINRRLLKNNFICTLKTRYNQKLTYCIVKLFTNNNIKVFFYKTLTAVTPGQSVVFYKNNICLGGGIIKKIFYTKK